MALASTHGETRPVSGTGGRKQARMVGVAVLLVLLCLGSVAVVLLPFFAPQWSGSINMSPLFGLVLAMDLVLGAWLVLRLQDRWLRGSRFTDETDSDIGRHRMTLTDSLTVGGFVLLVLTVCLAIYISTLAG